MNRIAFTIAYNCLHHLQHKNFTQFMLNNFDLWVVVEGQAKNGGSTDWCNPVDLPATSKDGTVEYLSAISEDNFIFHSRGTHHPSKDAQVNIAIGIIKTRYQAGMLWQVDVDEHWTTEKLEQAEGIAEISPHRAFAFQFNHLIKQDVVARGDWGSSYVNRLWKWRGERFATHEPAVLMGQKRVQPIQGIRFDHYSYIFAQDVKSKSLIYSGHQHVYDNWLKLSEVTYPAHISVLFGSDTEIGKSNSYLHKI